MFEKIQTDKKKILNEIKETWPINIEFEVRKKGFSKYHQP